MKIQTQAIFLVIGIVAVPLFVITSSMIFSRFLEMEDITGLPKYEDVSALQQENFTAEEWESFMYSVARFRNLGDIVIFQNDFLVVYSDLADFKANVSAEWEDLLPMMENQRFIFSSIGQEENRGYVLVRLKVPSMRERPVPFFIPAFIVLIVIGLLTLFTICMSIIIARTITNSVRVLENATRRIAEGELDLKVEAKGSNEIISLTKSLNKMRDALKEDELRRSRFIMGITHDLKTPLALIKGYAEAIEDGVADPGGAAQIITGKADQLEDMINDLISYVRMETGERRMQLKPVNLPVFLNSIVKTFNNDVELMHHTLTHEINLPDNISILLDESLALRAFENLIHNAVRYTPDGSVIHLCAAKAADAVEITISDNGPGLEKEDLPHIFEMFYRGSSSRREQGIGLGLAVVKWVADYHGWQITASSEKGQGTKFLIAVPVS